MRILITGISGFIGYHLTKELISQGHQVVGFGNSRTWCPVWDSETRKQIEIYDDVDLLDTLALWNFLHRVRPVGIFHLAAEASIVVSRKNPIRAYQANIIGTENLLSVVKACDFNPPLQFIQLSSSSDVYGLKGGTLTEGESCDPTNPYGVSKLSMELIGKRYHREEGLPTFSTRLFTTAGPGQYEDSALGSFSKQVALIARKKQDPIIKVGNLNNNRTFQDVRDVVKAFYLLSQKIDNPTFSFSRRFNISGSVHNLRDLLDLLLRISDVKNVEIIVDDKIIRKNDITCQVGDQRQLEELTGFKHTYTMEQTLKDMFLWWYERV